MGMSETLKAISDPVRRKILELLKSERLSAGEIGSHFELTEAGLVTETREKNFIYYELNVSVFEDVLVWIYQLGGKNDEKN